MRDLEDVLKELKAAEKEYAKKCKQYGITESGKDKKDDVALNESTNVDTEN